MRLLLLVALVACSSNTGPAEDVGTDARDVGVDANEPDANESDASNDAPEDAAEDAREDAAPEDSGNDTSACEEDAPCDLDDDPCTRDVCRDGECVAGTMCPSPQICDAELGCVCPFADLKVCGDLCISTPTCCDDSDCTEPESCPGPGSFCSCPSGFRPCDGECIPGSGCCENSDCPLGSSCVDNFCEGP